MIHSSWSYLTLPYQVYNSFLNPSLPLGKRKLKPPHDIVEVSKEKDGIVFGSTAISPNEKSLVIDAIGVTVAEKSDSFLYTDWITAFINKAVPPAEKKKTTTIIWTK